MPKLNGTKDELEEFMRSLPDAVQKRLRDTFGKDFKGFPVIDNLRQLVRISYSRMLCRPGMNRGDLGLLQRALSDRQLRFDMPQHELEGTVSSQVDEPSASSQLS